MEIEMWKSIKNYEDYYMISSYGNIKSLERRVVNNKGYRIIPEKLLNLRKHTAGYYQTVLCKKGIQKYLFVHRLVAEAFIGEIKKGFVINHKDGNKRNNIYTNLEIITPFENIHHAINTGLNNSFGINRYNSKLTKEEVLTIRDLYNKGTTLTQLVKLYPLNKVSLFRIVHNQTYKRL